MRRHDPSPADRPAPAMNLPTFPHVEARALNILRTLGTLRAAAYLRDQGVSEDVARRILLTKTGKVQ